MYVKYRNGIVPGKESFPMSWVLGENLLYLGAWTLAAYLLWPVWQPGGVPVFTLLWVSVVLIFQVLLKKHICSGCYYYGKTCHLGWGKLSSAWFPRDSGNLKKGMKLAFFYILSPPVILVTSLTFGLVAHPSAWYWICLGGFVLLNIILFPVRKQGCGQCAMREVCPGSAVAKQN